MSRAIRRVGGLFARPFRAMWSARSDMLAAGLSGVGVFMSFPSWDLFPLAFVALVPLLVVAERSSPRRTFALATWMGWVTNLGGFYWVTNLLQDYGYMPLSVSAGLCGALAFQQGLTWGVAFALGRWVRGFDVPVWLAYPAGLAIAESVMPLIFPWYFGNSQYLNHAFAQAAELGGVVLLSALIIMANSAVFLAIHGVRAGRGVPRTSVAVLALVALVHGYGALRISMVDGQAGEAGTLNVGMVQANIGIYDKHERTLLADQLLAHQRLSAELAADGADLVVWPETAYAPPEFVYVPAGETEAVVRSPRLDRYASRIPPSSAPLAASSADDDTRRTPSDARVAPQRGFEVPLLTGTVMWSRRTPDEMAAAPPRGGRPWPWNIHNAAMLLDRDGTVLGTYDKTMRMIFSEHVPGGRWLWRVTGINLYRIIPAAGDFFGGAPTDGFVLPTDSGDVRIGIMICYEDIMPSFGRAIGRARPELVVNVTNDAWFGDTAEPYLHLALATFRAIELRTPLLRATNTGVSAVIDPVGRIAASTATYEEATLLHPVPRLAASRTPFVVLGNWPPWLAVLCIVGYAVRRRRSARKQARDVAEGKAG